MTWAQLMILGNRILNKRPRNLLNKVAEAPPGLVANGAPEDWCDPDSSEEELGPDMEYMESYGRVEQRQRRLARATGHGDGGAAA